MKDFKTSAIEAFEERVEKEKGIVDWGNEVHCLNSPVPDFVSLVDCSQKRSLCKSPETPIIASAELLEKRIRLMEEEMQEFKDAAEQKDIVGMFDALVDQGVILFGTILELGFKNMYPSGFREVCAANYTKAREDGIYNINGVNTELLPEYPVGKFLKDKRFYHEPNLVKVMLGHAYTKEDRELILTNLLGEHRGETTDTEGSLKRLSYAFQRDGRPHYVGVDIYNKKQSQEDWVKHVLTQLNYIQNVCKFNVIGEERGYVNPDGTPTSN